MAAPCRFQKVTSCIVIFSYLLLICAGMRLDIFSTKTAYNWVQDPDQEVKDNEYMETRFEGKWCNAVRLDMVLRHGARQPGYKDIRKMSELHQKLQLTVTSKSFPFLNDWENQFPEIEEKNLVDAGEEEQYFLGTRLGKRLKRLFGDSITGVKFVSSSKDRAKESALAMFEGLTEEILHEAHDDLKPDIRDDILRFHTACGKFIETVENNRTYLREYVKFKTSPLIDKVSENVANRLGMEHARLDAGELKLVYFLCTFEMIILERDDWCQLLSDEDREILEYHNDLKTKDTNINNYGLTPLNLYNGDTSLLYQTRRMNPYRQYWKKAYGHPVIGQMACPLVENIFKNMDKAMNSILNNRKKRGEVATFFFGHAETLAPLYAALGLFNDTSPLLSTNYDQMKHRKFKSSRILPFSANIALILYDCNNGVGSEESEPSEDMFVVRVYVNEEPVLIPACNDYVCRYKDVRDSYKHHVDHCDFQSTCSLKNDHDEL